MRGVEGLLLTEEERAVGFSSLNRLGLYAGSFQLARLGDGRRGDRFTQVEFQLPTATRGAVDERELQAAEVRQPRFELNAERLLGCRARIESLVVEHDGGLQRRQGMKGVRFQGHERARRVTFAPVRGIGGEADRPIDEQRELRLRQFE